MLLIHLESEYCVHIGLGYVAFSIDNALNWQKYVCVSDTSCRKRCEVSINYFSKIVYMQFLILHYIFH